MTGSSHAVCRWWSRASWTSFQPRSQEAGGKGWAGCLLDSPGAAGTAAMVMSPTHSLAASVPMTADALGMVRVGSDYHYLFSTRGWSPARMQPRRAAHHHPRPPTAVLTAPPHPDQRAQVLRPSYPHSLSACHQHTLGQAPVWWGGLGRARGTAAPCPLCSPQAIFEILIQFSQDSTAPRILVSEFLQSRKLRATKTCRWSTTTSPTSQTS